MIEIKTTLFTDIITEEKIISCIKLLPKEYSELKYNLIISDKKNQIIDFVLKESIIKHEDLKEFEAVYFSKSYKGSTLVTEKKDIFVILYGGNQSNFRKDRAMQYISALYHEIKHVYQVKSDPDFYAKYDKYVLAHVDREKYNDNELEKDAIAFQTKYFPLNRKNIEKIMEYNS